jgi:hypothetical protein
MVGEHGMSSLNRICILGYMYPPLTTKHIIWPAIHCTKVEHTIIVAVAALRPSASVAPGFPPQQSPMFGHLASSQTVCSPKPRRSFLILEKEAPVGMEVLR